MNAPTVSVVMSAYNPRYLRASVESILGQSFDHFEFVIVDDSGSDAMWHTLSDYAERDPRLVLVRNRLNLGQAASLNKGFAAARGRYIARQDDDDVSAPARLELQVKMLEADPALGVVATQTQVIDAQGRPVREPTRHPTQHPDMLALLLTESFICHGSIMIRNRELAAAGAFDALLKPADDYDLWLRLAEQSRFGLVDEPLYYFRNHASSQSQRNRSTQLYHAASARLRALHRRFGMSIPLPSLESTGRTFLEAAIESCRAGDLEFGALCLRHARAAWPACLAADQPLWAILTDCTYALPAQDGIALCEVIFFRLLPRTFHLARLRSRFVAQLHMREVFAHLHKGEWETVDRHLWRGIAENPGWLLNKGILSTLIAASLRQLGYPADSR